MSVSTDIAIVGAGPYGLSIAAHLRDTGLKYRVLGRPMDSWLTKMPKGMALKSAGFASTLHDPGGTFMLRRYADDHGIPYQDVDMPIPLETFASYGVAFQQRFVPNVEDERLVKLVPCREGFALHLESGDTFTSRTVILAVGLDYFRYIPESLAHLPASLCTHSAEHGDPGKFKDKEVAVIGGGSSASDLAILLHEAGAHVQLVVRKSTIQFGGPWLGDVSPRPLRRRLRSPISGIGPGWRSLLFTKAPWIYHFLSDHTRIRISKSFLGPSGSWFMKERASKVPTLFGHQLQAAEVSGGRVQLHFSTAEGETRSTSVDHVIAATGYKVDVPRIPFLSGEIIERLSLLGDAPRLSQSFESSVRGLYFVGPIAAASFGPVMRFVVGAGFTSRTISRHLMKLLGSGMSGSRHAAKSASGSSREANISEMP